MIDDETRSRPPGFDFTATAASIRGLRPALPRDTPAVQRLIATIFADYDYVLDVEREDPHLRDPGGYFRATGGEFWVVENAAGEIVATVAVYLHTDAAELKSLYVAAPVRRAGLGRRLTELVLGYARQCGRRTLFLWSDTRFSDAHRLYEKLGFVRDGVRNICCANEFAEYHFTRATG
ncbi:MAG: GNAT family N-acetyltransferase [Phycisphaerae bacterium]